jgi:hypothetical protein
MLSRPSSGDYAAKRGRVKRTLRSMLTPEQMNVAILRESARVDRKDGGMLVLVLFRTADGDLHSPLAGRLVKTILHRIRVTDDVGWFDDVHVGVLLPDTAPAGAWKLAQHVCDRVALHGMRPLSVMYSYPATGLGTDEPAGVIRQSDGAQESNVAQTARAG